MRYFITFACYGAHLHGDEAGSVDPAHNVPGSRLIEVDPVRVSKEQEKMDQPSYILDHRSRSIVLTALHEVCNHRGWSLLAAHVRTNHVHVVVEADTRPESAMRDFKSYASRRLNALGIDPPNRKRWARHGSTRWLWKDCSVYEAIRYVVEEQGAPMAVYVTPPLPYSRGSETEALTRLPERSPA
ncbi:MAG: transposase [Terriglobia bacterium]